MITLLNKCWVFRLYCDFLALSVSLIYRATSRLAVVCGGSRGIGASVSQLLALRGHRVAVVSRNKEAAKTTVASLPGGKLLPHTNREKQ